MMTALENLHYAIGELAYAVAAADGKIQKEERNKFHSIVEAEIRSKDYEFDISDIIFQILDKSKNKDVEEIYASAMHTIKTNSHYLSPRLKETFITVMEKVAKAFPPVTEAEQTLLERFKADIAPINGDPVFYRATK
jgi:uncharacterized tellurite resistance protein B-like protein